MTYISNTFPTAIQSATDPVATDQVATFDHAGLETYQNDSIEALKTKVGVNSSVVTTSHDYKLQNVTGSDKAASVTGSETLTNKTLTAAKIANGGFIADANGNELIEGTTTASATNHIGTTNAATGTDPLIDVKGSDTNISLKIKAKGTGKVKLGSADLQFPNVDGTATYMLTTDGAGVLSWTAQPILTQTTPEYFNNQSTANQDGNWTLSQYSNTIDFARGVIQGAQFNYVLATQQPQVRTITSDWASAASGGVNSVITLGVYAYLLLRDASNNYRVYRYDKTNLSTGGTLMTISGQSFGTSGGAEVNMMTDGTAFFFNYKGGTTANDRTISRYTLSGTTLTYASDITCGASNNVAQRLLQVDSSTNIYVMSTTDNIIRKYNSSGTIQSTSVAYNSANIENQNYCLNTTSYIGYNTQTSNRPKYQTKIVL
jgi:hypothetical protein